MISGKMNVVVKLIANTNNSPNELRKCSRLSGQVGRHVIRSYLPSVMFTILSLRRQFKIHLMKQKVRSQFFILGKTHLKLVMMRMMAEMMMQQPRTRFQQLLQPQAHLEQLWWLKDKTRLTKYIYCLHWGCLQWKSKLDTCTCSNLAMVLEWED